jgi:ferrous iron transport protein B
MKLRINIKGAPLMHCHGGKGRHGHAEGLKRVALVGNPNVGKSVIFGLLSGRYATVSNYPGTTVELSWANVSLDGGRYLLLDTPGVNNLIPMSEDERVTRDILLAERPHVVLQVGDAKNLRRTLLLTLQLAEMGLPLVLDLNMEDEARDRGIVIDKAALREALGVEVVGTVAPERRGLKELRQALLREPRIPRLKVEYGPLLEEYIRQVQELLPPAPVSRRSVALMVLSGDESLRGWLRGRLSQEALERLDALRAELSAKLGKAVGYYINEVRLAKASELTQKVLRRVAPQGGRVAEGLSALSMHPVGGMVVLLAVLWGLYQFVGVFGAGTLVDFLEGVVFGRYLNPMFTKVVQLLLPIGLLQELLVGPYGLISMALTYAIGIILPITTTFFIAFAVLEDSGYLPRLAIMANRAFRVMGLSGKAVLPMVLGLGCGTMAVMTTRILETRRDRLIATFLLALAVPCSAQLGVILGMLGALSVRALGVWLLSVLAVLLLMGWLAARVLPGQKSEFMLEIPPMRMPTLGNVVLKTLNRTVWYLKEAVPLFMLGTLVLFVLDKVALLQLVQRAASPVVVGLLQLPPKATEAFLLGFLRRDYGAAGLFAMFEQGALTPVQAVVSMVTITLFVPCLAHFFMTIKEYGLRTALLMVAVIFPTAVLFGGLLNWGLRALGLSL